MLCKFWKDSIAKGLAAALILFGAATTASAVPVISIDLDPTTLGIQSSLSVASGSSFTIDMILISDGSPFDTFAFAADFNDLGPVLGLAGGTGSPTAGGIAVTSPLAIDAFTGFPVAPGSPMASFPVPPTPGFTASSGLVGMTSFAGPFGPGAIPPGVTIDLFSLTLLAMGPGTSTVLPSTGGLPPPLGGLALAGAPVPFTIAGGTVTVTAPPGVIPVPAAVWLFGTALIGLVGFAKRKAGASA